MARRLRSAALLASGALALPVLLTGCGADDEAVAKPVAPDLAAAPRGKVADGGTVRWAVDQTPRTLNAFQADADPGTARVAGAVLPALFTLDASGRPQRNADYLTTAGIVEREPKQVVRYQLDQRATWSNGRDITAADFAAQWQALSGKNTAYWTARNAGYDRIGKIERGESENEVLVTFDKPYADWRSLFTPLYPKEVMGSPEAFNERSRTALAATAGPFTTRKAGGQVTLVRDPHWWGDPAKLDSIVLTKVAPGARADALAAGSVDLAGVGGADAERIADDKALRAYQVRKSLEPAYTQLALNGTSGPLTDERVRRAVAQAVDRKALAEMVLDPLGLPAQTVGSHLALAGQQAYSDNSDALGKSDPGAVRALLAEAGWKAPKGAADAPDADAAAGGEADGKAADGDTALVAPARDVAALSAALRRQADAFATDESRKNGRAGAYAPQGTPAPGSVPYLVTKDGKPLTLRLVLPTGPGTESLNAVGEKVAQMLREAGISTETDKVSGAGYFKDHIAAGDFDLALYSWPGSAYPATDARPIYAKPRPAADGSLTVEQNYARVGTDHIDQLFAEAIGELDEGDAAKLLGKADARLWAAAGSIPLYQRPELVAAKEKLVNAGAFGMSSPRYQDIGYLK
ncbi:ABC transporter family substrate-binding protein [Streptomyces sp. NPDC060194]|uniref:ABC transporter family substrate-binding protein n=1 Tax=Streptomyces sp. NPDC060194 TaxID=3347069 RepID=UPI0036590986